MGGLSARERRLLGAVVAEEMATVTAETVAALTPCMADAANQTLSRLQRKGWLRRVTRGVYVVVPLSSATPEPAVQDAWPLTMSLFAPCYISGWSAAEHWDFTEQIFNSIAVVTTRRERRTEQTLGGVRFRTRTLPKSKFFGSVHVWVGSQRVDVADPHKLIIDILDDPSLGGGGRHTLDIVRAYWKSKHANATTLLQYAHRYKRGAVFKRLGFTAERLGITNSKWLAACRAGVSTGISSLDPSSPPSGRIVSRWNLRVNIPTGDE